MCGRMAITLPHDAMASIFAAAPANDLPEVPNYNVCPTTQVHIVTSGADAGRALRSMRWGLLPPWYRKMSDGPLLINARGETVAEKPAFRNAVRERRGLIIASGFYEWTKDPEGGRDPWYIIEEPDMPLWLGEEGKGAATLLQPAPDDTLTWHRVGREVNSNRAKGAELVEPV